MAQATGGGPVEDPKQLFEKELHMKMTQLSMAKLLGLDKPVDKDAPKATKTAEQGSKESQIWT